MNWTEELDDALKTYWENDYSNQEIADAMDLDYDQVKNRRRQLRLLKHGNASKLTPDIIDFLEENPSLSNDAVAKKYGVYASTVYDWRKRLALPTNVARNDYQPWEDELIRTLYPKGGPKAVAAQTGRNERSIQYRAAKIGVRSERNRAAW